MYLIDKAENKIEKIRKCTFSDLGFRERDNLQEWISKDPSCLGEELLIIQKEFSGFNDTNERLDLLALDKHGDLVIIENKLDDSGRDVTWQALKYASYCSTLSKDNIRKIYQKYLDTYESNVSAEEKLSEFFDNSEYEEIPINKGLSQRIILIAANFRKEVTSTVLWLMNYKLKIQCLIVTPYSLNEQLFLNFEQIIPMRDAEDYMISMAEKVQDDIDAESDLKNSHIIRLDFWKKLLAKMNEVSTLFQNVNPSKDGWISAGSGISGIAYVFAISKVYCRVEISIARADKEENKSVFDSLYKRKTDIESEFGESLAWERLDNKKSCRIKSELQIDAFNRENWTEMTDFLVDMMLKLEKTFKKYLAEIKTELKK